MKLDSKNMPSYAFSCNLLFANSIRSSMQVPVRCITVNSEVHAGSTDMHDEAGGQGGTVQAQPAAQALTACQVFKHRQQHCGVGLGLGTPADRRH